MCGIVGMMDLEGSQPIPRLLLAHMNETQLHRGPDEGSLHLEPGLGLGHRRLSIIDLSTGQQPIFNEDGSVVELGIVVPFGCDCDAIRAHARTNAWDSRIAMLVGELETLRPEKTSTAPRAPADARG